jgi:hypothetical protein
MSSKICVNIGLDSMETTWSWIWRTDVQHMAWNPTFASDSKESRFRYSYLDTPYTFKHSNRQFIRLLCSVHYSVSERNLTSRPCFRPKKVAQSALRRTIRREEEADVFIPKQGAPIQARRKFHSSWIRRRMDMSWTLDGIAGDGETD